MAVLLQFITRVVDALGIAQLSPVRAAAITAWDEARGDGVDGMHAVLCVIANRVKEPGWWGHDVLSVCLAGSGNEHQFSCWNPNDPNRPLGLRVGFEDAQYKEAYMMALQAVEGTLEDITSGADSYYRLGTSEPSWAKTRKPLCIIGHQAFYRVGVAGVGLDLADMSHTGKERENMLKTFWAKVKAWVRQPTTILGLAGVAGDIALAFFTGSSWGTQLSVAAAALVLLILPDNTAASTAGGRLVLDLFAIAAKRDPASVLAAVADFQALVNSFMSSKGVKVAVTLVEHPALPDLPS